MRTILTLTALATVLVGSACEDRPQQTAAMHAPPGVQPGSYEDWCEEHGVAETQCTQCHPELIAAFKATGDWCPPHGLPHSQCKKCNPKLVIQRPPKP